MKFRRKTLIRWGIFFLAMLLIWLFRFRILFGLGNYLIVENDLQDAEVMFVLSGDPGDRGNEAARIWKAGYCPKIVCLGGEVSGCLKAWGEEVITCTITQKVLLSQGVDSSAVELLCEGSSTYEEYLAIREYCRVNGFKKIMVLSSKFHTRRIDRVFRWPLITDGVKMVLRGAPSSQFKESEWWKSEPGLLFVNNEYVKSFYYMLKY